MVSCYNDPLIPLTLSRGRNCITAAAAAAAVAAWPLGPLALALALALFSTMPHGALSRGLVLPPLLPLQPNMTCDNAPYPFGARNASLPGFEVTCGPNNETMLPIGEHSYKIAEVSVMEGFVIIFAGPISQVCYDRNGKPRPTNGTVPMNLEGSQGTPFSFSNRSKLVATGCNYKLLATFFNPPDGDNKPPQPTSCTTWCTGSSDAISNGSCGSGRACCETPVPMDGAQDFNLTFDRTSGNVTGEEDGTCSAAFFLDRDEEFFTGGGDGGQRRLKDALLPTGERRMILDWAIGRATCDQARSYSLDPLACNDLSACIDAPSGAGYVCKCNAGYEGNPYVPDRCVDIDECRSVDRNNCTLQDFCHNTEGGYTCSCPKDKVGDGYRTGTNCTEALVPYGSPMQQTQGLDVCNHPERKKGSGCQKHSPLDIALGVGLALVVTISTTALCYYWAMKKREVGRKRAELFRKNGGLLLQQRFSAITSQSKDSSAKIFSAEELKTATDNYSGSRILGRGGHGTVYKGILPDKTVVAVKKSTLFDESQAEQFVNEITILSQIDHPNVVKLLGCCLETQVPLLVYEYIPNGTLFQHIHNRSVPHSLTWEDCLRIAAETAEGLAYLHSTSSIPIIHRDIKSSNILLDENFVAKISDFGASRSVPFDQTHVTTLIQGTIGYLDPEYFQSSQLTEKSDVYSFGVVLAELLTRQKPISVGRPEESCNLAMYMVILFNEGRLLHDIDPHILAEAGEEQLCAVAQLSVRCLNLKGEERPVMKEVASVLDGLRRSFTMEQSIRRKDESVQKNNEQDPLREARSISDLHSSEGSTHCSMDAQMLASSYMPR